jgi:hypothetical protein
MKNINIVKELQISFIAILVICINYNSSYAQNCVCAVCVERGAVSCSADASAHYNTNCPVYKNYHSGASTKTQTNTNASIEQMVMESIFTNMFNNMLYNKNNTNLTDAQKLKQQQEEQIRQQRLEAMVALQKKYNDSIAQARHDKMMKDYKSLDAGTKDLKYKGLIDNDYNDPNVVQLDEQKWLDNDTQSWIDYQKEQFRIRTEQPNYWCEQYVKNLVKQDSILNAIKENQINYNPFEDIYTPPKRLSEVQAGDVVLVGSGWAVDEFAHDINKAADHTLTCVKVIKGKDGKPDKRLYLDAQPGVGPKIITEEQMIGKYGKRELNVAGLREEPWGIAQALIIIKA